MIAKEHVPAHVEGTELRERQTKNERWLVDVKMADGRRATADLEEAEWKTYQVGERVRATYAQGDYTGSVWWCVIRKP